MPIILAQAAPPPAAAAHAPLRPSLITQPDWLAKPSGQDMAELYPKEAAQNRVEGSALLSCDVDATGALVNCAASAETPPGAGFGAAVLALAPKFRMRPMAKDGVPVSGGHVRIPIRFVLPKSSMPSFTITMRCYGYAAAASEAGDTSDDQLQKLTAWRLLLVAQTAAERQRPSEFEGLLVSLRKTGAEHLKSDAFKAERDECVTAFPGNVGEVSGIIRQVRPNDR